MSEEAEKKKKIIADNLKHYRSSLGLSQEELADLCNLHRTYIGSVERCERNITINTMCTLANALKITVIELLKEHENHR